MHLTLIFTCVKLSRSRQPGIAVASDIHCCSLNACDNGVQKYYLVVIASVKTESIRRMPPMALFCVISTALLLHGEIIVARGPTKRPERLSTLMSGWLPKSHVSFEMSVECRALSV